MIHETLRDNSMHTTGQRFIPVMLIICRELIFIAELCMVKNVWQFLLAWTHVVIDFFFDNRIYERMRYSMQVSDLETNISNHTTFHFSNAN